MPKIKCTQCENGWVTIEENGCQIRDACYHCDNTGFINAETFRQDKIASLAMLLASCAVAKVKRTCSSDPESEGWVFHAAESGMSEYEYTTAMTMLKYDDFGYSLIELDAMNPRLITALLDREDENNVQTQQPKFEHPKLRVILEDPMSPDEVPF